MKRIIIAMLCLFLMNSCIIIMSTKNRSQQDKKILNNRYLKFTAHTKKRNPNKIVVWIQQKHLNNVKKKMNKKNNKSQK